MAKTSATLLTNVRRRAQLSQDSGQALSDADVLAFASDELQNVIGPKIYAMRGWHYAAKQQYTLGAQRYYRIPDRAAGGTIISVEIVNSPIPNRPVNYVHPLQASQANGQPASESYYLYNNNIILSTGAPSSGTMIVRFLIAPSTIYQNAYQATAATFSNVRITGTAVGSPLLCFPAATAKLDIVRNTSPYEIIVAGFNGTGIAGTDIGVTDDILNSQSALDQYSVVDNLSTTDLVAMINAGQVTVVDAGSSYSPQLNDEFHDLLAQRTAMRCMESIGHTEDLKNMSQKLADLEQAFLRAISPRERGDIKVILTEDFFYDRRF